MFSIEPFNAMRETLKANAAGGMSSTWKPCKAIGVTMIDGEPHYVIEVIEPGGLRYLETEVRLRSAAP